MKLPKCVKEAVTNHVREHLGFPTGEWAIPARYTESTIAAALTAYDREVVGPLVDAATRYVAFPASQYRASLKIALIRYDEMRKEMGE